MAAEITEPAPSPTQAGTSSALIPATYNLTATVAQEPPKPGYKTTEFYLKLAALLLSALFASGLLTNDRLLAVAGMIATVLTSLGYTVSRTLVKR